MKKIVILKVGSTFPSIKKKCGDFDDSVRLAYNDFESNHAVCFDKNLIWGVEFHPELDAEIIHMYVDEQRKTLGEEGFDLSLAHDSVKEHNYGSMLLSKVSRTLRIFLPPGILESGHRSRSMR